MTEKSAEEEIHVVNTKGNTELSHCLKTGKWKIKCEENSTVEVENLNISNTIIF